MRNKILMSTAAVLLVGGFAFYSYSLSLSKPKFNETLEGNINEEITLASLNDAVTLAVSEKGNVLLVVAADASGVKAIDIASVTSGSYGDAIDAYTELGYQGLYDIAESEDAQRYAWGSLGIPVTVADKVVAAGTNYKAHAEEVSVSSGPFLFPKLSKTTGWNAPVNLGSRLDYEVELCSIPLTDFSAGESVELGYLLCGDFTDRWLLMANIDLGGEMGKTGFPPGKGGVSHLPVGSLFVIPVRDDFYKEIDMKLYVNNQLRQHSKASLMIWDPWTIMEKALADCNSIYINGDEELSILSGCKKIPAKTLFLTGTPEGTLFNLATMWNSAFYLGKGDVIDAYATYLGVTKNVVN